MIYSIIIILLVALFYFPGKLLKHIDTFWGSCISKCPVCGNSGHWVRRNWGSNKDYDDEFCSYCHRTLRDMETGEFTTFSDPQAWY